MTRLARDLMTPTAHFCKGSDTASDAAKMMARHDIGALPICDANGRLTGVISDRDLALNIVAQARNADEVSLDQIIDHSEVVTIGADDSVEEAIATMKEHAIRRLPVIDGTELVGMLTQADIARAMPDVRVGDLLHEISTAPANN